MPSNKRASPSELPAVFRALSDFTRLRLMNLLAEGEVCVCHLGGALGLVQPKVSRHLAYLKRTGLVEARQEGPWMHYRWARPAHPAVRATMEALRDWMAKDDECARERRKLRRCVRG